MMHTTHGFSLLEVVIALVLVASTSLTLLKWQWYFGQQLHAYEHDASLMRIQSNRMEQTS